MAWHTQELEEELQVLLRTIGSDHLEIQEVLESVLNKPFYFAIQLIGKLSEIMDQLLRTGNYLHHHDLNRTYWH